MIDFINTYNLPFSNSKSLEGVVYESLQREKTVKTNSTSHYQNFSSDFIIKQGELNGENYFHSSEDKNTWVDIIFEEEWIIPTAYVIADSGNKRRLMSWNIEASQDGINYDILDSHFNSTIFKKTWQIEAFRLNLKRRRKPYRIFRLQQTGPMSEGSPPLRLGRLEIYGVTAFCFEKCTTKAPNIIPFNSCSFLRFQLHSSILSYLIIQFY